MNLNLKSELTVDRFSRRWSLLSGGFPCSAWLKINWKLMFFVKEFSSIEFQIRGIVVLICLLVSCWEFFLRFFDLVSWGVSALDGDRWLINWGRFLGIHKIPFHDRFPLNCSCFILASSTFNQSNYPLKPFNLNPIFIKTTHNINYIAK